MAKARATARTRAMSRATVRAMSSAIAIVMSSNGLIFRLEPELCLKLLSKQY